MQAGKVTAMKLMSRRLVIRGSLGLTTTGILARPHIANAAATSAIVWQVQGFVPEEDAAFRKTVEDYQRASGNRIDLSIMPFTALNQKAISALTSGDVPDLIFHDAPATILPQFAWDNKLEDVSDVVEPHRANLSRTAVLASSFYNSTAKKRSFYLVPIKQGVEPFHIWGDLVEEAGFKLSDAPNTWNAFWDFFKPMQKVLRAKGHRKLYALALQITTPGPKDGNGLFPHIMFANGGSGIVSEDGRLHTDNPQVREAAIKSVEYLTNCFKEGYVPPEALSWNDADDNNAYHEKLILMDLDGTLSTELPRVHEKKKFEESVTLGLPNGNDGKPMSAPQAAGGGFIPKGAKNVAVAKDFMRFFLPPQVMNENLKQGLGRWVPSIPSLVKSDPFWLDTHLAPYVHEAVLGPTLPDFRGYNPAWGQVGAEQLWGVAHSDVIREGMTPAAAVDKAFKRADAIFSKYTFG